MSTKAGISSSAAKAAKKIGELPFGTSDLLRQTVFLILGFLLSLCSLPGEMSPFAAALTSAAPSGYLIACFVGSSAGSLLMHGGTSAFRYIAALTISSTLNQTISRFKKLRRSRVHLGAHRAVLNAAHRACGACRTGL